MCPASRRALGRLHRVCRALRVETTVNDKAAPACAKNANKIAPTPATDDTPAGCNNVEFVMRTARYVEGDTAGGVTAACVLIGCGDGVCSPGESCATCDFDARAIRASTRVYRTRRPVAMPAAAAAPTPV